jgi:GMP synthase (glutamine-hydrolysing)
MKIGILQTGHVPQPLSEKHGDYDDRMRWLLGAEDFTYVTYDIEGGKFPASVEAADGWIITGSKHGAYEDHGWLEPLEIFIRQAIAAERPVIGICFGHQIVAKAMGGTVEKSAEGWVVGLKTYEMRDGSSFAAYAWHQDQVVTPPPGAEVIVQSDNCRFAGLSYPGRALTLQSHPEFTGRYFVALLEDKSEFLPPEVRDAAQSGSSETLDGDFYPIGLLREFMKTGGRIPSA